MRPLTDHLPKPLLQVGGKPLIVWHIERLAQAGIRDIVINHAWLGSLLEDYLGDGSRWDVRLGYSAEGTALETAGGIAKALPLLGEAPFLVINGDIWCDWQPRAAAALAEELVRTDKQAWLLLVDNPAHHPQGDFQLLDDGSVGEPKDAGTLTFSGVGIYQPSLFAGVAAGRPARLAPLLVAAMGHEQVIGARHEGRWVDVGTPERLTELDASLQ